MNMWTAAAIRGDLCGAQLHPLTKVLAVADAYEAMTAQAISQGSPTHSRRSNSYGEAEARSLTPP